MHKHNIKLRYTYFLILAIAIVMIIVAFRFIFIVETPLINHIGFREDVCGMTIEPYYDEEDGVYYLFLPSYASSNEVSVTSSVSVGVNFSDGIADYGDKLDEIPLQEDITLTLTNFYQKEKYTIQIWQCENLSTVYLETLSGSLDDVNADKNYELDTSVVVIDSDGKIELNEKLSTLSGRGNGTWSGTKKPYILKFSSAVDIGPFESVKNLCMLANYSDESRIRNDICYYAGESLGIPYSSPYMNVDVYVDGEYLGLYGLTTKYEYKKYIESDQIKAVFEMQISNTSKDGESFDSNFASRVNVMYGDLDEIQESVGIFETALRTQDWDLCNSVIDLRSFAEKYIYEEFIANHDLSIGSSYQSKFFYLDNDDTIHCMLPWDYDWSLASSRTFFDDLEVYELNAFRASNNWFIYLLQDEEFRDEVVNILYEEFTDEYLDELCRYVDDLTEEIDSSWQCDLCRWKDQKPYNTWENSSGIEDMKGYAEYFDNYFYERRAFLIECFSDYDDYCRLELRTTYGTSSEYFNIVVPKGTDIWSYMDEANVLDTSRSSDYEFSGWYTDDGVSLYDIDVITEDLTFRGEWEKPEITVATVTEDEKPVAAETSLEEPEPSSENLAIQLLKRVYHFFGLESFDRKTLVIGAVFVLVLIGLFVEEMIRASKRRR